MIARIIGLTITILYWFAAAAIVITFTLSFVWFGLSPVLEWVGSELGIRPLRRLRGDLYPYKTHPVAMLALVVCSASYIWLIDKLTADFDQIGKLDALRRLSK